MFYHIKTIANSMASIATSLAEIASEMKKNQRKDESARPEHKEKATRNPHRKHRHKCYSATNIATGQYFDADTLDDLAEKIGSSGGGHMSRHIKNKTPHKVRKTGETFILSAKD